MNAAREILGVILLLLLAGWIGQGAPLGPLDRWSKRAASPVTKENTT